MLLRQVTFNTNRSPAPIRVRCPGCRDLVTLEPISDKDRQFQAQDPQALTFGVGERVCPNSACRALLLVVYDVNRSGSGNSLRVYPAERIDFDAGNLPQPVLEAIEEAITCHSQECYVASAIMVRKTLEEVCRDRGADGNTLKDRVAALGGKVVLPQALLDGLDHLRLLGNDAAHVESREYEQVGQQEVEVALDVAKEILKATYQMDSIVERLASLRRGEPEDPS